MNAERLIALAALFHKLASSLVKNATAVCKECGYDNPYMDPDPNYVCRQCKMRAQMWGGKEEPEKPKPITRQPAHTSAPYSLFDRLTRYFKSINTIGTDLHFKDAPVTDNTYKLTMIAEMTFLTPDQQLDQFKKFSKVITEAIPPITVATHRKHVWHYGDHIDVVLELRDSGRMILGVVFPTGRYKEPKTASLAARFEKLATSKSYQEGFQDGTEDIHLDQWGSPREAYIARKQHHEMYVGTPFDIDYAGYRQGYMAAAFTSEKKHEINKGFQHLPPGSGEEHAWKHRPHNEKGETSFEGVLEEPNVVAPTWGGRDLTRAEQNAVARVQRAANVSFEEAITFVMGVGPDVVLGLPFEEIRINWGK
jgi:hypothetical protein